MQRKMDDIELYDTLKRKSIEDYLGFFEVEMNLEGLPESTKNRLRAIAAFLKNYRGVFPKWDQLLAYFNNELNVAKANGDQEHKKLIDILNSFNKNIFADEGNIVKLAYESDSIKTIVNSELKTFTRHLHLARFQYPLLHYLADKYPKEHALRKEIEQIAIDIIGAEDTLTVAKIVGHATFTLSSSKINHQLKAAYVHIQQLLTTGQRLSMARFNLSLRAKQLEQKLIKRVKRYSQNQDKHYINQLTAAHWNLKTKIPFGENDCQNHWMELIDCYNEQINNSDRNNLYRIACLKNVDTLIKHVILPYPNFNFAYSVAVFKRLHAFSTQKANLVTKLKRDYNSEQPIESRIEFLDELVKFNQKANVVDPFLTKAIIGLVNQGITKEQAEKLRAIASTHNQIIGTHQTTWWRRLMGWLHNEDKQSISVDDITHQQGDGDILLNPADKERCEELSQANFQNIINANLEDIDGQISTMIEETVVSKLNVSKNQFDALSLDEKIKLIREHLEDLKQELRGQFRFLLDKMEPYEAAQKQILEQKKLLKNDDQAKVYTELLSMLAECFLGAKAVASGKVKLEKSAKGKAGRIVGVVGALLPVPLFGKLVAVLGVCIAEHDKYEQGQKNRQIARITLTCSAAEQLAELTARRVAALYKDAIILLADDEEGQGQGLFVKDVYHKIIALLIGEKVEVIRHDPIQTAANIFAALRQPMPKTPIVGEVLAYFGWSQKPLKLKTGEYSVSTEQILCNPKLSQSPITSHTYNSTEQASSKNFKKETDIIGIVRHLDKRVNTMSKNSLTNLDIQKAHLEIEKARLENENLREKNQKLRQKNKKLTSENDALKNATYEQILLTLGPLIKGKHTQPREDLPKVTKVFAKPVSESEAIIEAYQRQILVNACS